MLDDDDTVSLGSRSICQAKHSLEIWDRFGIARRMVEKGITWEQGEVYLRDQPIYRFNLQPEPGHKFPAFVNLQQYYVEEYLYERCAGRDRDRDAPSQQGGRRPPRNDGVTVEVETPDGRYTLDAEWLVACDGVRSPVRHLLGLPYPGEVFHDQFLIADIQLTGDLPKERRFWFYPPFHPTNSVLLHRQADDILRVDFQLGRDADAEEEKKPENVDKPPAPDVRPRGALGARMDQRLYLHLPHDGALRARPRRSSPATPRTSSRPSVRAAAMPRWPTPTTSPGSSPGAGRRGAGKPARQLLQRAPRRLAREHPRIRPAAPISSRPSSRPRGFSATPRLSLARDFPFARALINSGRLSVPTAHVGSPLDTPDGDGDWVGGPAPGRAMVDAPLEEGWLVDRLGLGFHVVLASAALRSRRPA